MHFPVGQIEGRFKRKTFQKKKSNIFFCRNLQSCYQKLHMRNCAISCFLRTCVTAREESLFDLGFLLPDAFVCAL